MKLLKQGILVLFIGLMITSVVAAQDNDKGVRDTLRLSPTDVDWLIEDDSISPAIEIWGWSDADSVAQPDSASLTGASIGFIVKFDTTSFDPDIWHISSTDKGVSSVDSLIMISSIVKSNTLPPHVQFGGYTASTSTLDQTYAGSGDLDWGYNGFSIALVDLFKNGSVFSIGEPQKIADVYLKFVDVESDSLTPNEFSIIIDSSFFPPGGIFKYSYAFSDVSGGQAPFVVPCTLHVTNLLSDADDADPADLLPQEFQLAQNYPNPFNPTTTVKYYVASKSIVNLSVYNILGQRVATLVDREMDAGWQEVQWNGTDSDGNDVASGVYFYKMAAGDYVDTKKMLLMK